MSIDDKSLITEAITIRRRLEPEIRPACRDMRSMAQTEHDQKVIGVVEQHIFKRMPVTRWQLPFFFSPKLSDPYQIDGRLTGTHCLRAKRI